MVGLPSCRCEETPCASGCSNLEEHAHLQIIMRRRSFDVLPTAAAESACRI